jgi:uncharacterized protein (UPF0261 family)
LIEKNGLEILIINFGVMGELAFAPDITRQEVAKAGGGDLATLAFGPYKDVAMRVMAAGLAVVVRRLFDDGRLDGIASSGSGVAERGVQVGVFEWAQRDSNPWPSLCKRVP